MPPGGSTGNARTLSKGGGEKSKMSKKPASGTKPAIGAEEPVSIQLQQLLLNIFRDTFPIGDELFSKIQEVKQHLFNREFSKAFGSERLLEAYAMRWSATRALAYMDLLCSLPQLPGHIKSSSRGITVEHGQSKMPVESPTREPHDTHVDEQVSMPQTCPVTPNGLTGSFKVICLGGGAGAELASFAAYLQRLHSQADSGIHPADATVLTMTVVDIADWSSVIQRLHSAVTTSPRLSPYTSSVLRADSKPLIESRHFRVDFKQQDVLAIEVEPLAAMVQDAALVTLMFTLNELYASSMSKTTNLLLSLTSLMESGSLLLVVDSPGTYSTVRIGNAASSTSGGVEKRYPMQWLLDHTLLEASTVGSKKSSTERGQWEKLISHDSKWFRLPKDLKYPIDLEDTRYQIHLYRRK